VISVPALSGRLEDLPDLARHFLRQTAMARRGDVDVQALELNEESLRPLAAYEWPGNVRELKHVMELSALLADGGPVGEHDVREALRDVSGVSSRSRPCDATAGVAHERIVNVLTRCNWNTEIAAAEL